MLYSGFNILPRSVFWSADFNGRSDNLDVIRLNQVLGMSDRNPKTNTQSSSDLKTGALLAMTVIGAFAGYALSGEISDGPAQSKMIAQGAFWGALVGALTGVLVSFPISGFKIRLSSLLELVLVAALVSMLLSNLLHWNSVLKKRQERNLAIEEEIRADYNAFIESLKREQND